MYQVRYCCTLSSVMFLMNTDKLNDQQEGKTKIFWEIERHYSDLYSEQDKKVYNGKQNDMKNTIIMLLDVIF